MMDGGEATPTAMNIRFMHVQELYSISLISAMLLALLGRSSKGLSCLPRAGLFAIVLISLSDVMEYMPLGSPRFSQSGDLEQKACIVSNNFELH